MEQILLTFHITISLCLGLLDHFFWDQTVLSLIKSSFLENYAVPL